MSVRTILSWYLSFKMFEKISYSLIIKNLIKTGHFCDLFYIGAKIFIVAHHGFHHSVWQCLKYLGYEAYVYAHSPGRGPQLDPKKTRKPYFSRLYQKVDFVRLFSRWRVLTLSRLFMWKISVFSCNTLFVISIGLYAIVEKKNFGRFLDAVDIRCIWDDYLDCERRKHGWRSLNVESVYHVYHVSSLSILLVFFLEVNFLVRVDEIKE